MDFRIVKFLMLWMLYINIELTTSMPSQGLNTRTKRSPANNFFGLNLGSPFSAPQQVASDTFASFGNIFTGNSNNKRKQIIEPPGIVNSNPFFNIQPAGRPNNNIIPSSTQNNIPEINKNVLPQETKVEGNKKTQIVTENLALPNDVPNTTTASPDSPVPIQNAEKEKSDEIKGIEKEVDKELLDYIFQNENSATTDSNVDNSIEYTTMTGEFETTTLTLLGNRIQPAVVASLLG